MKMCAQGSRCEFLSGRAKKLGMTFLNVAHHGWETENSLRSKLLKDY